MGHKPLTVKSIVRRAESIPTTVSVRAVVLATPTPAMATMRHRATPLTAAVNRVKSRIETVEKGQGKLSGSSSATLSNYEQDEYSGNANIRHDRDGEAKDPRQGGHRVKPATTHLCGQAARGLSYACRLQHPEGVDSASGAPESAFASHPTPVLMSTGPRSPVLLPLVVPHTPPDTPPQLIVSTRDPLGLCDPPRIPSPRTSNFIGQRLKAHGQYRPVTREWEKAGLLPGVRPLDAPQGFDYYGRPIARPRELYYPRVEKVGREMTWRLGPWEIQHDRGVPPRPLPSRKAMAPPSPRSQVREGRVTRRMEQDWESQEMDFDS